jgi:hypothetical protein
VTAQEADDPVRVSVHDAAGVNVPAVSVLANWTVPVGVAVLVVSTSVTVAVHVVVVTVWRVPGEQATLTFVGRMVRVPSNTCPAP